MIVLVLIRMFVCLKFCWFSFSCDCVCLSVFCVVVMVVWYGCGLMMNSRLFLWMVVLFWNVILLR